MSLLHKKSKILAQRLSSYHLHILVGIVALLVIGIIGIVQLSRQSDTQTFAKSEQNIKQANEKYIDKRYDHFEAKATRHSKKSGNHIENPQDALGHCDLQQAPRESDQQQNIDKSAGRWSPPCE